MVPNWNWKYVCGVGVELVLRVKRKENTSTLHVRMHLNRQLEQSRIEAEDNQDYWMDTDRTAVPYFWVVTYVHVFFSIEWISRMQHDAQRRTMRMTYSLSHPRKVSAKREVLIFHHILVSYHAWFDLDTLLGLLH